MALIAIIAAGGMLAMRGGGPALDPARVLVVPFEMAPDVPNAAAISQRLESAIVQSLQRTGLASVTDTRAAISEATFADTARNVLANTSVARRLARAIGAGLVVTGRVSGTGDTLTVEARLLSTASGSEVIPIAAETWVSGSTRALHEAATQRLMGALSMHRDPRWGSSLPGAQAPNYAAYRYFQQGNEHWDRAEFMPAADRFLQAYRADTTFLVAAVRRGYALLNQGQYAAVDSLGAALEPRRDQLSPYETQYLNRLLAWTRGDLQGFLYAAREMANIAPQSNIARYTAARSAMFLNHMTEARDGLRRVQPDHPDMAGVAAYYADVCNITHRLEDYESQLAAAREWQAHPRNVRPIEARACEASALAPLGRLSQVDSLLPLFISPRLEGNTSLISRASELVRELRWHGHDSVATRLTLDILRRAGTFLPADERFVLLFSADTAALGPFLDSLHRAAAVPQRALQYYRALQAALRQDRALVAALLDSLTGTVPPYDRGQTTYWRAEAHALLGEKETAVQLLRQAHLEGVNFQAFFHANTALEPLRGYPPFEAFVKPK